MYFPRKILKPEVDVNTYYYYCRCCCCRWWHLLLGLLVLRPSISSLLQSATSVITKCDSFFYYKVRQLVYYKVRRVLLQSATGITKCDGYYKVWQYIATPISSYVKDKKKIFTARDEDMIFLVNGKILVFHQYLYNKRAY